jgi:hypothetical protein
MKKLFIVLAVASLGFVACNNDAEKTDTPDSAAIKATADSIEAAAKAKMDNIADSATNKIDSVAGAAKDTLKSKM